MKKATVLLMAAAAYVAFLQYEANIAMSHLQKLQELYTSTGAPNELLAASNR